MSIIKRLILSNFVTIAFFRSIYKYKVSSGRSKGKKQEVLPASNWLDIQKLKSKKRSNKIFILGSGQSLLDLCDEDWREIERHDSLSLNFNVMLDHIPSFFMFEMPRDKDRKSVFLEWLERRSLQYGENRVSIIVRNICSEDFCNGDIPENIEKFCYICEEIPLSAPTRRSLKLQIKFLNTFLLKYEKCVPTHKGSLFTACYLAALLEYKEVYLVGFDLNNTKYFYEHPSFSGHPTPRSGQAGVFHKTAISTPTSLSISDSLDVLNKSLFKERGVSLYSVNDKSLLSAFLDVKGISASVN